MVRYSKVSLGSCWLCQNLLLFFYLLLFYESIELTAVKLAFRQTVHKYGVDLCWTPMILAKEFNRNQFARDSGTSHRPLCHSIYSE